MNVFKKTFVEFIVVVVILVLVALALSYFVSDENGVRVINAQLAEQNVTLEVADNTFLQGIGLSGREYLEENHGMIFVYDQERENLSFWMKDTLIPLDIIFLNADFEVVEIIENVPICEEDPCPTYDSEQKAQYVIELNAGWVEENNLKEGDLLKIKVPGQSDS